MEMTEKERKILLLTEKYLPDVKISPLRGGNESGVSAVHYFISPYNKDLIGSDYFYNEPLKLVHFTRLNALQSIISEKTIRLYNLNNLNDPREYGYAGDLIFFNYKNKKEARENIFLLSMCKEEIVTTSSTEIEFNLWRLYGNNGFGVAVILNFEDCETKKWKDYFISKVHYGSNLRTRIKDFNAAIKKLETESPIVEIDLGQIVCFHKSRLYGLEQEVRLLFDKRDKRTLSATRYTFNDEILSPIIRPDIEKSAQLKKKIQFLELPIFHNRYQPITDEGKIPIPRIDKIILGYQYKRISTISSRLQNLCHDKLGYTPSIEKSRLTKYYHDK